MTDTAFPSLDELRERYDRAGPRYTSYPTAPEWRDSFGASDYESFLQDSGDEPLSVYIHVPFCEKLCAFCACTRTIPKDRSVIDPFLTTLETELERVAGFIPGVRPCTQLALGGGSPNYLDEASLARLVDAVDKHFPPAPDAERSAELDPRRTRREQLEVLAERGFNRVSFGVQDLDPNVQAAIHRSQSPEKTAAIIADARALGFEGVNVDLIYGLPEQTPTSFSETLRQIIELRPDRLALYGYAHVTWLANTQRSFNRRNLPSAEDRVGLYMSALERFAEAGYRHLGLDHFALPDDELSLAADSGSLHRNFMGYTVARSRDLVAFGPSAISEVNGCYAQSARDVEGWRSAIDGGHLPTFRGWRLSEDDLRRQWLIRSLMCNGTISPVQFRDRFGIEFDRAIPNIEAALAPVAADGLIAGSPEDGWRVTENGKLFLRSIAMLFDAYLEPAADGQRYSRVV